MDEHISLWDPDRGRVVGVTDAHNPRPPGSLGLFWWCLLAVHLCTRKCGLQIQTVPV